MKDRLYYDSLLYKCLSFLLNTSTKEGVFLPFFIFTTQPLSKSSELFNWASLQSSSFIGWMLSVCKSSLCFSLCVCFFFKNGYLSPFGACVGGEEVVSDIPSLINAPIFQGWLPFSFSFLFISFAIQKSEEW